VKDDILSTIAQFLQRDGWEIIGTDRGMIAESRVTQIKIEDLAAAIDRRLNLTETTK
jgi:2C-methyl-D-erythritol 2,4-cyclodiphosphate synthase